MFARLTRFRRPTTTTTVAATTRPAMFEPLEGRQLYSVSTLSAPVVQTSAVARPPAVHIPAVQQPAGTNIIAILIGL